jgi:hypothetical protein
MDHNEILRWVVTGALALNAYFARNTITYFNNELKELKRKLEVVQQDYLHKTDFREFKSELRGMFEEIKQDIRDLKAKE